MLRATFASTLFTLLIVLPVSPPTVPTAVVAAQACGPAALPPGAGSVHLVSVGGRPSLLAVSERWGHVFVASNPVEGCGSSITMLDARTGRIVHRVHVGHLLQALVADDAAGRILAVDSGNDGNSWAGSLIALDARTGRVLKTIRTGPESSAIGIDKQTWRAFVLNAGVPGPPYVGRSLSVVAITRGIVLRTLPLGANAGPTLLTGDEHTHRVFVQTAADFRMLDSHDGREIAQLATGGTALGVDSRTSRLFVFRQQACGEPDPRGEQWSTEAEVQTIDSRSGTVLRTVDGPCGESLGGGDRLLVDERAGLAVVTQSVEGGWGALSIDAGSGAIIRQPTLIGTETGGLPAGAVDERTGMIYFAAPALPGGSPAVIRRLDPRTWSATVVAQLPISPAATAVAQAAHRVYIASAETGTVAVLSTGS